MKDACEFFCNLYQGIGPDELIEIRSIRGYARSNWFGDPVRAARAAASLSWRNDVYFGVATRATRSGKREDISRIYCVWADLDDKPDMPTIPQRFKRTLELLPSAVVHSGKGLHLYWFLTEPLGRESIPEIEMLNKAIAARIGGDSVFDAPRILRVPQTFNHKYGERLPVRLIGLEPSRRYTLEELKVAYPASVTTTAEHVFHADAATAPKGAPLPCRVSAWDGVDMGARNNACFQLAVDLKRQGTPRQVAEKLLLEWNKRNRPPMDDTDIRTTVAQAYRGSYSGLGCDKEPWASLCVDGCVVKRPSKSSISAPEPEQASTPLADWSASELLSSAPPPPEFVVDGIVPKRGITLVTGDGGVGKSFLLLDLACAVASGGKFLGHFDCEEGPVCVIDLENDEATIARRLSKVIRGRSSEADLPVYVIKKGGIADAEFKIDSEGSMNQLLSYVEARNPRALVIDPLTAAHSRDENDNVAMRSVIRKLAAVAREQNLAVVLVHHPRKRGLINDPGQMIRGASDLRNAVDSHLFVRRTSSETLVIDHDKSRHSPAVDSFRVEMKDTEDDAVCFDYTGEASTASQKSAEARELILSVLEEVGECKTSDLVQRAKAQRVSTSTLKRVLSAMCGEEIITKCDRGVYALVTQQSLL